jgi:hypothetical protein
MGIGAGKQAGRERGKRMGRAMNFSRGRWALGVLAVVGLTRPAAAIYLDEGQNFSLRARIYSQFSIRTENSQIGTTPITKTGQLVQNRNYYNPELDIKGTSYTTWMKGTFLDWLAPDDFHVRLAAWGFYDGIYDYGSAQFDRSQRLINSTFPNVNSLGSDGQKHSFNLQGPTFDPKGTNLDSIYAGFDLTEPRNVYAHQQRVNEFYFSYSKGPVFVRFGRQAISWGESDTIALLDQNNPFDVTQAAPGLFEDLDEARIPLWTLRTSLTLFDTLGPLSSGFIEAYWVPGPLDVNVGFLPQRTASPYSPRGPDPQEQIPAVLPAQFVLLDHVPKKNIGSSRYGFRVQTVVNRTHTVSAWAYTHFPNAPVPLGDGLVRAQPGGQIFTTETVHELTWAVGLADTFFLEPLDAIIRAEAEYFINEPSFIPQVNLNITEGGNLLDPLRVPGQVPHANYLRWELGFDRFFFLRALNPTNSFTLVTAIVGSYNLDETSVRDFRQNGQFKPEFFKKPIGTAPQPDDFVQQKTVEAFGQVALRTDYMHGRLQPGLVAIQNVRGTWALNPTLTYRFRDWLLFTANFIFIGGEYQQIGFFRDRDQASLRVTYQLN